MDGRMADAGMLVAVSQREFARGCRSRWLRDLCPEFESRVVGNIEELQKDERLARADAVILDASTPVQSMQWLEAQAAWLHAHRPDVPVIAILEATELASVEPLMRRLAVQGYIPTSNSLEVAAAALRLVVAGGTYFPRIWQSAQPMAAPERRYAAPATLAADALGPGALTPRERAVLGLLEHGTPNKIIAHQLNMSLSTAKVHVHNIIRKLKVQNRTEAALASRAR